MIQHASGERTAVVREAPTAATGVEPGAFQNRPHTGRMIGDLEIDALTAAPLRQMKKFVVHAAPQQVLDEVRTLHLEQRAPSVSGSTVFEVKHTGTCAHVVYSTVPSVSDHLIVFRVSPCGQGGSLVLAYQYFKATGKLRALIAEMVVTRVGKRLIKQFGGSW